MNLVGDVIPLNLYDFLLELKEDLEVKIPNEIIQKLGNQCEKILDERLKRGTTVRVTKYNYKK